MSNAHSLAQYLREQAQFRSHKVDEHDDDRNTRSGMALLDAAEYVEQLADSDPRLEALAAARVFIDDPCSLGEEAGHIVRLHGFHGRTGSPSQFLGDLVMAARRDAAELDI